MSGLERIESAKDLLRTGLASARAMPLASSSAARARVRSMTLLASDIAAFGIAAGLAFIAVMAASPPLFERTIGNAAALGVAWHGWGTLLVLVSLLSFLGMRGHYASRVPFWTESGDVTVGVCIALAADVFITVAVYDIPQHLEGVLRWVFLVPCLLLMRSTARAMLNSVGLWSLKTLIIADSKVLQDTTSALTSEPALGYELVGATEVETAASLAEASLTELILSCQAEFVVVAVGSGKARAERAVVESLMRARLPLALVPALDNLPVLGFRPQYFFSHDVVMLVSRNNLARPLARLMKAVSDQIGAALLVLLLAPLLLILALLVRMDGGPALFSHRRIGAGGRSFPCLKFRTMVLNADRVLQDLLAGDPEAAREWRETQKLRNDPRVTPVGRFLRRTSLDELPQLFNVLRGEMSLIGPRPIVQDEIARYGNDIEYYYEAKPGLTGLWQVSGRSDTSYDRRVKLDVWYVRNWTLWHDIAILLKTIPAVFLRKGAH